MRKNLKIQEFIARRTARLPSPDSSDNDDGNDDDNDHYAGDNLCPAAFGLTDDDPRVRALGFQAYQDNSQQPRSNRMCLGVQIQL